MVLTETGLQLVGIRGWRVVRAVKYLRWEWLLVEGGRECVLP